MYAWRRNLGHGACSCNIQECPVARGTCIYRKAQTQTKLSFHSRLIGHKNRVATAQWPVLLCSSKRHCYPEPYHSSPDIKSESTKDETHAHTPRSSEAPMPIKGQRDTHTRRALVSQIVYCAIGSINKADKGQLLRHPNTMARVQGARTPSLFGHR